MSAANAASSPGADGEGASMVTPGRVVVLNGPPPTAFRQLAEQA